MVNNWHGLISFFIADAAVVIGFVAIFLTNPAAGIVYLMVAVAAPWPVLYFYCAKCTCREDGCGHTVPGKLTRFLPARAQGPYTLGDYIGAGIPLAVMFLFPQYWLWHHKALFIIFWGMLIIALFQIRNFVCPACRNAECVMCAEHQKE